MNPSPSSAFAPLHAKVEATRATVADSIERALENTAKLEHIEAQSVQLEATTSTFRKESASLQRKLFWKNVQMKVAIGAGILMLLGAIVGVAFAMASS